MLRPLWLTGLEAKCLASALAASIWPRLTWLIRVITVCTIVTDERGGAGGCIELSGLLACTSVHCLDWCSLSSARALTLVLLGVRYTIQYDTIKAFYCPAVVHKNTSTVRYKCQ